MSTPDTPPVLVHDYEVSRQGDEWTATCTADCDRTGKGNSRSAAIAGWTVLHDTAPTAVAPVEVDGDGFERFFAGLSTADLAQKVGHFAAIQAANVSDTEADRATYRWRAALLSEAHARLLPAAPTTPDIADERVPSGLRERIEFERAKVAEAADAFKDSPAQADTALKLRMRRNALDWVLSLFPALATPSTPGAGQGAPVCVEAGDCIATHRCTGQCAFDTGSAVPR